MECASDPDCKAFRYSLKYGTGFFCNDTDAIKQLRHEDWELCSFGSSQYSIKSFTYIWKLNMIKLDE